MKTVVVGDVHGCNQEFQRLLRKIDFQVGHDRLLLTGDAFSRGPDPAGVWQTIKETEAKMVLGNHDAKLQQLLSEIVATKRPKHQNSDQEITITKLLPFSDQLLPWLQNVPLYIETETFLLVHAGINPEKGLDQTTRDEFLTIRRWPPAPGIHGLRWHDFITHSNRTIIFGHDAPGGLICRNRPAESIENGNLPYLLGLDTGCVYGGQLSACLLEECRLVNVESERIWFERQRSQTRTSDEIQK